VSTPRRQSPPSAQRLQETRAPLSPPPLGLCVRRCPGSSPAPLCLRPALLATCCWPGHVPRSGAAVHVGNDVSLCLLLWVSVRWLQVPVSSSHGLLPCRSAGGGRLCCLRVRPSRYAPLPAPWCVIAGSSVAPGWHPASLVVACSAATATVAPGGYRRPSLSVVPCRRSRRWCSAQAGAPRRPRAARPAPGAAHRGLPLRRPLPRPEDAAQDLERQRQHRRRGGLQLPGQPPPQALPSAGTLQDCCRFFHVPASRLPACCLC
jgi:hypothetical protein